MIFLPKRREMVLAAQRNNLQTAFLSQKNDKNALFNLKRIYLAEALSLCSNETAIDIIKYSDTITGAAILRLASKGKCISAKFSGTGTYCINKKLYTIILLSIINGMKSGETLNLSIVNSKLKLSFHGCGARLDPKIIKKAGAVLLKESSLKKNILIIPLKETTSSSETIDNEFYYLRDRCSPVNLFIS